MLDHCSVCMASMFHVVTMTYIHDQLLGYDVTSLAPLNASQPRFLPELLRSQERFHWSIIIKVQVPLPPPSHPNISCSQDTVESEHKYQKHLNNHCNRFTTINVIDNQLSWKRKLKVSNTLRRYVNTKCT